MVEPSNDLVPIDAVDGVVLCDEVAAHCICAESAGHTTPHVCECGGQWRGTIDQPDFDVVAWPTRVLS